IDRKLDIHVALDLAAAGGVDEFLGRLGDDGVAVVVKPVDQRADRGIFLILDDGRVIESAEQGAAALEFLEQALVIDLEADCPGRHLRHVSDAPALWPRRGVSRRSPVTPNHNLALRIATRTYN